MSNSNREKEKQFWAILFSIVIIFEWFNLVQCTLQFNRIKCVKCWRICIFIEKHRHTTNKEHNFLNARRRCRIVNPISNNIICECFFFQSKQKKTVWRTFYFAQLLGTCLIMKQIVLLFHPFFTFCKMFISLLKRL